MLPPVWLERYYYYTFFPHISLLLVFWSWSILQQKAASHFTLFSVTTHCLAWWVLSGSLPALHQGLRQITQCHRAWVQCHNIEKAAWVLVPHHLIERCAQALAWYIFPFVYVVFSFLHQCLMIFRVQRKYFQLFTTEYDVACMFVIYDLYYAEVCFLYTHFVFIINRCWVLPDAFSASIEMIIWFLFFSLLIWHITLIDL